MPQLGSFEEADGEETNNYLDGINLLRYLVKGCKENQVKEGFRNFLFCLFPLERENKTPKNLTSPNLNFSNFKWEHDFLYFAKRVEKGVSPHHAVIS